MTATYDTWFCLGTEYINDIIILLKKNRFQGKSKWRDSRRPEHGCYDDIGNLVAWTDWLPMRQALWERIRPN